MTRFTTSAIDPRRLSVLPHRIANMHPGRREHIYGKIQPLHDRSASESFMRGFAVGLVLLAIAALMIGGMA